MQAGVLDAGGGVGVVKCESAVVLGTTTADRETRPFPNAPKRAIPHTADTLKLPSCSSRSRTVEQVTAEQLHAT